MKENEPKGLCAKCIYRCYCEEAARNLMTEECPYFKLEEKFMNVVIENCDVEELKNAESMAIGSSSEDNKPVIIFTTTAPRSIRVCKLRNEEQCHDSIN